MSIHMFSMTIPPGDMLNTFNTSQASATEVAISSLHAIDEEGFKFYVDPMTDSPFNASGLKQGWLKTWLLGAVANLRLEIITGMRSLDQARAKHQRALSSTGIEW